MLLYVPTGGIIIEHRPIGERMTERKRNPEEILEEMINKNVKFQVFEIFSGVAAGVSTVVLAVTQNVAVIAAAPLTLSIALNYLNRRRLDQLTRQQTLLDITEVQRRLSSEIQGIRGQTQFGAGEIGAASSGQFENAIASLSETVASLEMRMQGGVNGADTSHLDAELVQLRNHQLDLSQSIEAVNQQLRAQPAANSDVTHFEAEIAALKEHIAQVQMASVPMAAADLPVGADLSALRSEMQEQLNPLHIHLSDLESRLAQINQTVAQPAATMDVEPLRAELMQMVAPVHQQVMSLEERLAAQPVAAMAQVGSEEIQAVHSHVNTLNDKLDNIAAQLTAEIAGFQQTVDHTQERLQTVHQQVEAVHQNVSAAPPVGFQPEAMHQELQAAIGPLREQLGALEHKLNSTPAPDANVSQLQSEQMISLQNQLNGINGLVEEISNQFTSELTKVHSELSKVPELVEKHVDHKVATLQPVAAVPAQDSKKDALSELDAILADINL